MSRCNKEFREVPFFVKLHKELNNPTNMHNFGSVDRIMLGLCSDTVARRDQYISDELTNHLFQNPRVNFGLDLAAMNIQRGRDHGLAPYNIWREQCGLRRFRSFEEGGSGIGLILSMNAVMGHITVSALRGVYDHVDDVDLFTGGLAERPVVGGTVGPTFACIIGQQFLNLRKGDRFWYENGDDANAGGALTFAQLQEIRKASLSRTICDNLDDIDVLQPYVFLMQDEFSNRRVSCRDGSIPRVNLQVWREARTSSSSPLQYSGDNFAKWVIKMRKKLKKKGQEHHSGGGEDAAERVDTSEQLAIHQSTMPAPPSEEGVTFTSELPRQISRRQYFDFFKDEGGDGREARGLFEQLQLKS